MKRAAIIALVAWTGGARAGADEALVYRPPRVLLDTSLHFGFEPHSRASSQCSKTTSVQGGAGSQDVSVPQCNLVLAFGVGVEALWRGLLGAAVELIAAEGSPVQPGPDAQGKAQPAFGDRISVVLAFAARPFAPLAWRDGAWWRRLTAGFGLQLGASVEHARVSLDSATNLGLHLAALLDVPIWHGNSEPGLSLRLAVRLLLSPDAPFTLGSATVDEPGTAVQLFAGLSYYL